MKGNIVLISIVIFACIGAGIIFMLLANDLDFVQQQNQNNNTPTPLKITVSGSYAQDQKQLRLLIINGETSSVTITNVTLINLDGFSKTFSNNQNVPLTLKSGDQTELVCTSSVPLAEGISFQIQLTFGNNWVKTVTQADFL